MRHLTLPALVLAAAVAAIPATAGADPVSTDPSAPVSTETPAVPEPATADADSTATVEADTPAAADGARQVTYTVTTTSDLTANIYYVIGDPPDQAAANDPKYMPMARTLVGPGAPWTFQTTLNDPDQWAFVSASGGLRVNPEFRCEIAVDGTVVQTQQGGSGVQCSLRSW